MPNRTWIQTKAPFGAAPPPAPPAAPAGAAPNAQNGGALLLSELGELEPFYVLLWWSRRSYKMQLHVLRLRLQPHAEPSQTRPNSVRTTSVTFFLFTPPQCSK